MNNHVTLNLIDLGVFALYMIATIALGFWVARKGRDTDRLSKLCDQMGEIARQMADLGRAEVHQENVRNLQIVSDNLVMLENEFDEIVKANAS